MDNKGQKLAEWTEALPAADASVIFDSADIRARFGLPDFTGQLFIHIIGAAGHDVVKYALDTYGDDKKVLSCTHDANAWPSDQYAGLPAPTDEEEVVLWVQNSHPSAIPAGDIGLNLMGHDDIARLEKEIPAYGSYRLERRRTSAQGALAAADRNSGRQAFCPPALRNFIEERPYPHLAPECGTQ